MAFDFEQLKQFNLDQIKEYYLRLSDRERYIAIFSALGASVLLLIILISTAVAMISSLDSRLKSNREVLSTIEALKAKYQQSRNQVDKLEAMINRTPKDFSLASHLESLAQSYNIQPDSMNPKTVAPNELYAETQIEVRIAKVSLPTLIDYLYKIENSQGFIRVSSLSVKPNYADTTYLNAVFTVSVFTAKS